MIQGLKTGICRFAELVHFHLICPRLCTPTSPVMALALASPMASLSLHYGRISAAAIGGGLRPRKVSPVGASSSSFLRSSFVSSSSTSSTSTSRTSLSAAVSASLAFTSASSFAGSSLGIEFSYNRLTTGRSRGLQIRAGKAALCLTKRSRSRKSLARVHGFRRRMRTTAGRKVLKRRRDRGRKILCTKTNSPTGTKF